MQVAESVYSGIPIPLLNINLHVAPNFTGRVVVNIENGKVICDRRIRDDEHICSLDTFIELARETGLRIEASNDR